MKTPQYYLQSAIADGFEPVRFLKDYSGRGMYGKTCIGISGSNGDCRAVLAAAMTEAAVDSRNIQLGSSREETDEYMREMFELLLNHSSDNMGHGVVFYWTTQQAMDEVS